MFKFIHLAALLVQRKYPYANAFILLMDFVIRKITGPSALKDGQDAFTFLDNNLEKIPKQYADGYLFLNKLLYHGMAVLDTIVLNNSSNGKKWHIALATLLSYNVRVQLSKMYDNPDSVDTAYRKRLIETLAILLVYIKNNQQENPPPYYLQILHRLIQIHVVNGNLLTVPKDAIIGTALQSFVQALQDEKVPEDPTKLYQFQLALGGIQHAYCYGAEREKFMFLEKVTISPFGIRHSNEIDARVDEICNGHAFASTASTVLIG